MTRELSFESSLLGRAGALVIIASGFTTTAVAQSSETSVEFDMPAQSLDQALRNYGVVADKQVMFSVDLVNGKTVGPIAGEMTPDEALQTLLADTGLMFETTSSDVILIRTTQRDATSADGNSLQTVRSQDAEPHQVRSVDEDEGGPSAADVIDVIVVTGTNIRGTAPSSSPVLTFDRETIQNSGLTTTEQFLRTLPVNFDGGQSEFAPNGFPNDFSSGNNASGGNAANLRGLGSNATLVVLNGARIAPSSRSASFVDLSMIPVSALERIEVLTDGASSIYGGDAVAGVINFITRRDYEGAETAVRYGTVTDGDLDEYRVSQTLGKSWSSGNVLAVYEYFDRSRLSGADRPNLSSALASDGAAGASLDDFDLSPEQDRHSALLSLNQSIGERIDLTNTLLFSKRSREQRLFTNLSGTRSNRQSTARLWNYNGGAQVDLFDDWAGRLLLTYSNVTTDPRSVLFNDPEPVFSVGEDESELFSVDLIFDGTVVNLPGGSLALAVGGQFRQEDFQSIDIEEIGGVELNSEEDREIAAIFAETSIPILGVNNQLPGLKRLELNASVRLDDYSDFGSTTNPKYGILWSLADGLAFRASYSESFNPPTLGLVGQPSDGNIFPQSLLNAVFGVSSGDPSVDGAGTLLVSGPAANLQPETSSSFTVGADYSGNILNLPFDFNVTYYDTEFENRINRVPIPGNQQPFIAPVIESLNPGSFPEGVIQFGATTDQVQAIIDTFLVPPTDSFGVGVDGVSIINNAFAEQNIAATQVRGIDFDFETETNLSFGTIEYGLSGSYLIEFSQQASATTEAIDALDTLNSPISLNLRGRIGYSNGVINGSVFVNHLDSYQTDSTEDAIGIDSWTTIDAFFSVDIGEFASEAWTDGLSMNLSAQNLLDEQPPETPSVASGGINLPAYDPANASPLGRFIGLEIRKRF